MTTALFTPYDTTNSERNLHERSGRRVEILGDVPLDHDEFTMTRVRFEDGFEAEAFADELTEQED